MADDKSIKTFTADDIEKYHKGKLSPKEMHDLEKAALDDDFLAEALDGYMAVTVDVNRDIEELRSRLAQKTESARVIPISKASRPFPWVRIAVILVVLAGGGFFFFQFLANNKSDSPLAENQKSKVKSDSQPPVSNEVAIQPDKNSVTVSSEDSSYKIPGRKATAATDLRQNTNAKTDSMEITAGAGAFSKAQVPAARVPDEKKNLDAGYSNKNVAASPSGDVAANTIDKDKELLVKKQPPAQAAVNDNAAYNEAEHLGAPVANGAAKAKRMDNSYRPNVFRGTVKDANNNAMPFVNITNTKDNVGTFSDAQGNFTLISPDTVLNVQLKSIGFENNNAQLRNSVSDNRVFMQEDRSISANVLDTVKRSWSRLHKSNVTVEEPEPEDGWDSYSTYVANNINIPGKAEMGKAAGTPDNTVEISFEVNKYGEPVNIRVEKSLCDKCDEEAKRLIKEGPKWKRKTNKSKRTTVTIPFVQP